MRAALRDEAACISRASVLTVVATRYLL